jgi:5'-methylthioadenosine phosphorylase
MAVGIITGSGSHTLVGLEEPQPEPVATPWGTVETVRGSLRGVPVVHVSRHGEGHARLSNHVNHRGNVWALQELEVSAVVGCTACGAVDASLELGSLVLFDDLLFLSNRLPDGALCTFFAEAGDPARAHWVLHGSPFSTELRAHLAAAARSAELPLRDGGAYGHVDGPRFNTPAEVAWLARAGAAAVSQTGGPETVLCGEAELPYALVGFVTDYANEVRPGAPTPLATLTELMSASRGAFASLLAAALPALDRAKPAPAGTLLRLNP